MNIKFILDGPATGKRNMDLDLELHRHVLEARYTAAIRFYTWDPWCVSLGKHQSADGLNQTALQRLDLDVVHRPTGGRAVLHADEVTYCVCLPVASANQAQMIYAAVHEMLFNELSAIVPGLSYASVSSDLRQHYSSHQPVGQTCFSTHAKSEILWNGHKVVGSAQRVMDGVLLQHGSILCGPGHEQLSQVVCTSETDEHTVRAALDRTSATLSQAANRPVTHRDIASRFAAAEERMRHSLSAIASQVADARR